MTGPEFTGVFSESESTLLHHLTVSGNPEMADLIAARDAELDPELVNYVEDGEWGKMLRHPLVYMVPLMLPGHANRALAQKRECIAKAIEASDWSTVVFLHERPYRLEALIEYVTGRDGDTGEALPVNPNHPETLDLVADVWVDSENIEQKIEDWRSLFSLVLSLPDAFVGTEAERAAFDALPDPIPAWRGGTVGNWSWTTKRKTAVFFSRRSGHPVRSALIPKSDCFGYLTRRGESELLVRMTEERMPLVYPKEVTS